MKNFKYRIRAVVSLFLLLCVCINTLSGCSNKNMANSVKICQFDEFGVDLTQSIKNSTESVLLLQDDDKRLYINNSGAVYIVDENDNVIWESAVIDENLLQQMANKDAVQSQVALNYQVDAAADYTMNSKSQSIDKGQFTVIKDNNKIIIQNIMGEFIADILLPEAIEKSRFEELIKKTSERDANFLTRQYVLYTPETAKNIENASVLKQVPALEEKSFYVLPEVSAAQKRRISDIWVDIGYTKTDLENDRAEAGVSLEDQGTVFKTVTEFYFDNGDLIVNVPCDQLYCPSSTPIISLNVFKYGDYVSKDSEGYWFVPSKSGAIFDYKDGKTPDYKLYYYGEDYSNIKYGEESDRSNYPVFGKYDGIRGYFAIIEQGAETIDLNIELIEEGYVLYPSIKVLDLTPLAVGKGALNSYAERPFSGDVTIRYAFLEGENSTYVGMANYYRNYLLEKEILKSNINEEGLPFSIEIINSIQSKKDIAGIKYTTEKVVTDFSKTKDIITFFKDNGISNLFVKLNGANKKGLFVQSPGTFTPSSKAGGKDSYQELVKYCDTNDISLFNNLNIALVFGEHLKGYSSNKHAARMLTKETASVYVKEKSTNNNRTDLPTYDVISPLFYQKYADNYIKQKETIGNGISIGELGWMLSSDYNEKNHLLRTDTKQYVDEAVECLDDSFNIMAENPNDYLLKYLSLGEKIPTESSGYRFFEHSVPFIQMVLHGSLQYTTEYLNGVSNNQEALLKAIETGSGLSYRFAESLDKDDIKDQNSFLYNANYELWKDIALKNYNYVAEALEGLNNEKIIDHKYLDDELVCVGYSNGDVIYINYSSVEKTVDNIIIDANSYVRK